MVRLALPSPAKLRFRRVIASEAIHSFRVGKNGLLRRFAPRNDGDLQIGNGSTQKGLACLSRQTCPVAFNHTASNSSFVIVTGSNSGFAAI